MSSSFIGKKFDNYRILEQLGRGGMGMVFKAHNIKLDKMVALKMIAPGLALNENFLRRFHTEARALAKLENPNIVRINDLREDRDQWFIVMEYVEGETLADKIKREGAIPWGEALAIFKQMMSAIDHAHSAGIIHRDIKPSNVILTPEGLVKITDFGLARDQASLGHTQTLASGGTLFYMSPEQVKGLTYTDYRSDIYALGFSLYEMITGKIPFFNNQTDFDIRESIIKSKFPPPTQYVPDLPPKLSLIIQKAIDKDPDQRFQSVRDMINAIKKFEKNWQELQDGTEKPPANLKSQPDWFVMERLEPEEPKKSAEEPPKETKPPHPEPPSKNALRPVLLTAIFIIIILGMFYLVFLSPLFQKFSIPQGEKALNIVTEPVDARTELNGEVIGSTPITGFTVKSDSVHLVLSKAGFSTLDTSVVLNGNELQDFYFRLQPQVTADKPVASTPLPATEQTPPPEEKKTAAEGRILRITSSPAGAAVWINNQRVGDTPYRYKGVKDRNYNVVLRLGGYETYARNIRPENENETRVHASLNKLTGSLIVTSDPPGAEILIDGKTIGNRQTPSSMSGIEIGRHNLTISKEGFKDFNTTVDISPEQPLTVNARLEAQTGALHVLIKPWGALYIDDELIAENTDLRQKLDLNVGAHRVRVEHPSLGSIVKTVKINEDQISDLTIDFNKRIPLRVTAFDAEGQPLWGEIIIDGQKTGELTPKEIRLRVGTHRIAVQKEGYTLMGGERELTLFDIPDEPQKFILKRNM